MKPCTISDCEIERNYRIQGENLLELYQRIQGLEAIIITQQAAIEQLRQRNHELAAYIAALDRGPA